MKLFGIQRYVLLAIIPPPQQRLGLLDGLMTGTMDRYASQPEVADRFEKVVGTYARSGH